MGLVGAFIMMRTIIMTMAPMVAGNRQESATVTLGRS